MFVGRIARGSWLAVLCLLGALTACRQKTSLLPEELRVFAASSLTEAMQDVAMAFERQHPEVTVVLNFAGSQTLRVQIEQGALADVFASANEAHMDALVQGGRVDEVSVFAENTLVIAVPANNPANIERFEDLALTPRIVVGGPNAAIGQYTNDLLERARDHYGDEFVDAINRHIVSREANVRQALAKVYEGAADAAFVYRTDVVDKTKANVVAIPESLLTPARYVVAAVQQTHPLRSTSAFLRLLRGSEGQAILKARGFLPVTP